MRSFSIERASTIAAAVGAAATGAKFIAGGTTLVDLMRDEIERPERLVDINSLPMKDIRVEGEELVLGALARMSEVAAHPDVQHHQPLIAESLIEGASPQLRNMATMGGNLLQRVRCPYFRMLEVPCNKHAPGSGCSALDGLNAGHAILGTSDHCVATHPSDVAVALVALDARMTVRGPHGERSFPVEDLYRLPGDTPHVEHTLRPGELITEIRVPNHTDARRARYLKVRDRASYEFAVVSAAVALNVSDSTIVSARIAVGGVGTKPWRLRDCEASLAGQPLGRPAFEAAAALATLGAKPLQHNHYKVELLPRTIVRTLELTGDVA
jgi:xanthine dehydrogenase YagS FAD-binding subunit